MSSLFLKLLEVNAPVSSRRSFLRRLKVDWLKKGQFISSKVSFIFWRIWIKGEYVIFNVGVVSMLEVEI